METKRGYSLATVFLFLFIFLALPLVSSDIIINTQPASTYNLGSIITIPVTLKTSSDLTGTFQMDLVCGNSDINFYKNGVSLPAGQQKNIEASLVLTKSIIGNVTGTCAIKAMIGSDTATSNSFTISDSITVNANLSQSAFNPGDTIIVKGTAIREDQAQVNGYSELDIMDGNSTILMQQGTVTNGKFTINVTLPSDIQAGSYNLRLKAYEKDSLTEITNNGYLDQKMSVNQVPTSLEIIFDNATVLPGTSMRAKAILHDQTGQSIDSQVFLTVKNNKDSILDQVEIATGEVLDFPITYNTPSATWKVVAASNKLSAESNFSIPENENVSIEIANDTMTITNTGNVPYNRTVLVKVGNQTINLDVYLKVDQSQKWILSAPDGQYNVQVLAGGALTGASVALTGNQIDVKKAYSSAFSAMPAVWIFVIVILGLVGFMFFKKGYKRTFIGYMGPGIWTGSKIGGSGSSGNGKGNMSLSVNPGPQNSKAELSLSIKGEQQDLSMITLRVKNMAAVKNSKEDGGAYQTIKKTMSLAEDQKAAIYDNNETICYIFSPLRTKTFSNEMNALKAAKRILDVLDDHNKVFKQQIDFGISLVYGSMIAKQESDRFKFMGMGNIMTHAKKIAAAADDEILMDERMADKVRAGVKAEKHKRDGIDVYSVKQIKDSEQHAKFLKGFMKRMEKDGNK